MNPGRPARCIRFRGDEAKNKVANDFHHDSGICSATKDAPIRIIAIGTVKEQGGKKVLIATKIGMA